MNKITFLEGVRGLAALAVFNEHIMKFLFPLSASIYLVNGGGFSLGSFTYPPFNFLHNGAWAVSIFLVLSGLVLSEFYFSNKQSNQAPKDILVRLVPRYFRLAIPIFVSFFLLWALNKYNLIAFEEMIVSTGGLAKDPFYESLSFFAMAKRAFVDVMLGGYSGYNPVFWMMCYEFIGSMLVFMSLLFFSLIKNDKLYPHVRVLFYIGAATYILMQSQPFWLAFVIGVVFSDARHNLLPILRKNSNDLIKTLRLTPSKINIINFGVLLLGLYFAGYGPRGLYGSHYPSIMEVTNHQLLNPFLVYWHTILGAAFLLYAAWNIRPIKEFFETRMLQWLGRVSYSLYLAHFIVISTFTPLLVRYGYATNLLNTHYYISMFVVVFITLAVTLLSSFVFEKLVNEPTIKLTTAMKNFRFSRSHRSFDPIKN